MFDKLKSMDKDLVRAVFSALDSHGFSGKVIGDNILVFKKGEEPSSEDMEKLELCDFRPENLSLAALIPQNDVLTKEIKESKRIHNLEQIQNRELRKRQLKHWRSGKA